MRSQSHKSLHREKRKSYISFCLLGVFVAVFISAYRDPNFWSDSNLKKIGNNFVNKFLKKFSRTQEIRPRRPKKKDKITDREERLIMTYKSIKEFATANKKREGGGFMVRRPIGDKIDNVDPFLMLDHLGPTVYGPGEAIGAPDHPHRGFETVTYVIDGGIHHKDSAGNEGNLGPGWVQWMTAGSGVVHSEMPTDELLRTGGRMEGFQLWVNLPKKFKMSPPRYQDTPPEKIPIATSPDGGTSVKVIAGECLGTKAAIETKIPIMFLDIKINRGSSFDVSIPENTNSFVYIWRGNGFIGSDKKPVTMGQVASLSKEGDVFQLNASEDSALHAFVIAGQPIDEPIARYGPFVMNTYEEIQQAFDDYRNGRLGKIDGAEERYAKTEQAKQQNKQSGNWNKH